MDANAGSDSTGTDVVVEGIRLATAAAGIRYSGRDDVLLVDLGEGGNTVAVFTQNRFCAAPVTVAREHLAAASPRYLVFNAGNANAGTGRLGLEDARAVTRAIADLAKCRPQAVLPFSTGVIGQRLAVAKINAVLPELVSRLAPHGWPRAARAIMTTDTVEKLRTARVDAGGRACSIAGIAKGSGMIHPNMATMLAFVATDANVPRDALQGLISECTARSFNRITVDGDTSTNDACVLSATGASGSEALTPAHPDWAPFAAAMQSVFDELAQSVVRDGEGATKFVEVSVASASEGDSLAIANTIALSPLVKTALFASDPNWGRILAAIGRAPVDALAVEDVSIWLDDYQIVASGEPVAEYQEAAAAEIMARPEFAIRVRVGDGAAAASVWTCDFSYDYVRINAEYRS